jgi:hypothetical protein
VITRLLLTMVLVASLAQTGAAQTARPASPMLEAADAFLATLKPAQKAKAVLPFNSEERFHWFYTPVSRKGIPLKELNALQRQAGLALLRAGLSEQDYAKAQTIRKLEEVLRELEQNRAGGLERGEGHYYRVQGSTFLIEYDNTQNNANHVHCVGVTSTVTGAKTCWQNTTRTPRTISPQVPINCNPQSRRWRMTFDACTR